MRKLINTCGALISASFISSPALATDWATLDLLTLVADGKCEQLLPKVNDMLTRKNSRAMYVIGDLVERGVCLKEDWENAAKIFTTAHNLGHAEAVHRLVSIYALKQRDPSAALWWAAQRPKIMQKECLPKSDPNRQAAEFLEELKGWSANKLLACTYIVGVTHEIVGRAVAWKMPGNSYDAKVQIRLDAQGRAVHWHDPDAHVNFTVKINPSSGEAVPYDPASNGDRHWWNIGADVLKKFGAPPQIDPSWQTLVEFTVERPMRNPRVPVVVDVVN